MSDTEQRVVWSAVGGRLSHHNASAQVLTDNDKQCRVIWIADVLPNEVAPTMATMIDQGLLAMKRTLEIAATN